ASDLHRLVPGNKPEIVVIRGAADPFFVASANELGHPANRSALERFDLDRAFLLCVGGGDFRKNLTGAIRAYATLPEELRGQHLLVIAGRLTSAQTSELENFAEQSAVGNVKLIGHVTDDELRALYGSCRAVLFPSMHEGLGLPVLEALASG